MSAVETATPSALGALQRLVLRTQVSLTRLLGIAALSALAIVIGLFARYADDPTEAAVDGVAAYGLAVLVPRSQLARLAATDGVAKVWPNIAYRPLLDNSPGLIGAPQMWGPDFSTAGNGVKIGIIDDGVDQAHPFFNAAGYTMPAGYPKGNTSFTNAKVIVARAFPAPGTTSAPVAPSA